MERRSFIAFALAFGSSFSLPVSRCLAAAAGAGSDEGTFVLDTPRRALLDTLTELIIPQTDTPGAIGAGVPEFIESLLGRGFDDATRARFLAGLDEIEARSHADGGTNFVSLPVERQVAMLQELEASGKANRTPDDPGFFHVLKELTLIGYYTSEPGATREARYIPMPGRYAGEVPLKPEDRAFAEGSTLDSML